MKRAPKLLWVLLALISSAGILKATLPSTVIGAWTSAVSLSQARTNSAAALLADGRILVTGGTGGAGSLNSAEFFTPNGTVSSATAMNVGRSQHFAVTLSDGRVLVGGGITGGGTTNSAEIYDPSTDSWTQNNPMTSARANASAVLLQDGRVLVVGGDNSGTPNNTIEIFDPSTGNFSFAGTLASPRTKQAMALLQDGRVLIIGGFDGTNALASSEIFDPSSGIVSAGPSLAVPRYSHSATTLLDGRVAIIGGVTTGSNGTSDVAYAEIFDPSTGAFSAAGAGLTTAREAHQAFLLPNNNSVLVVGGTSAGQVVAASELFVPQISPADGSWSYTFAPTGSNVTPRTGASGSAMQQDGLLLVAGGNDASGNALASTELYAFPVVKTDAPDYPPGATVNISGSGFQPNETVNITLVESPLIDTHGPYTVTADGNGNFTDSSFTTDIHDLNVRFYLTVAGTQSGLVAQNTFTDAGANKLQFTTNPFTATAGVCSSTITVGTFQGNTATAPTANETIALTSSSASGNFYSNSSCATQISTVTITTSQTTASFFYKDNTSGSPTITATPNPALTTPTQQETINPATATKLVFGQQPTNTAAGASINPAVTVQIQDQFGNLTTSTATVNMAIGTNPGSGVLSGSTSVAAVNGTATFSTLAINKPGVGYTLTASSGALAGATSSAFNVNVGVVSAANSTVSANPSSVTADGIATSTITVTLLDGSNNPVSGKTVTLSQGTGSSTISAASGPSNASGVVTFTVKDTKAEAVTYAATDSTDSIAITQKPVVTFTAGAVNATKSTVSASPGSVVADGSTTSTITVTLLDASNNPLSGKTVTLAQGTGSSIISAASGASNASGVVTFTVKDTKAETVTYSATDATDSIAISQTAQVIFTAGPASAAKSTVSANPISVTADGTTTSTITVTLLDANNNPASGKTVTLSQGTGSSTISAASGASDSSGVVTFTVKDTKAEAVIYSARDATDGVNITLTATVTFTAGPVSAGKSTVTANPTSVTADGTTTSTITVTLLDANNNPVSGKTVALSQGTGSSTISAASGASNASGVVTFTVKDTKAETVTYSATDTTDTIAITNTASVTFNPGAITQLVFGNIGPQTAGVAFNITVTAEDAHGNTVTSYNANGNNANISSTGTLLGGSFTSQSFTNGVLVQSVTITNTGSFSITADGNPGHAASGVSGTSNSFTVNPGAPAKLVMSQQPTSRLLNQTIAPAVTVQILDANNNLTTSTANVTVGLTGSPAGVTLGGTTTVAAVAGVATFNNLSVNKAGTYTLSASSGVLTGTTSTSFTISNPVPTLTSISPVSGNLGQTLDVLFTGTNFVNGASTVNFGTDITVNTTTVNSPTQITANITIPTTATVGAHSATVTVAAPGGGTTSGQTFTVNNPATTTVVTTSGSPSTYGQSVTFTATVTSAAGTPTGSVNFYDGGTCLAPGTLLSSAGLASGVATLTTVALSAGAHTIVASYPQTGIFNPSCAVVTQQVNKATASITVTPYSITFDGAPHTATGTATGVGNVDLSADLVLTGTTHSAAGDYPNDGWTFTDPTGNYNPASGSVHDFIGKATATITVTPYSVTYDGNPHTASGSATGIGNVDLSADLVLTGTTHTLAGDYPSDGWTFTDPTGNYNPASGSVHDVINQVQVTIVLSNLTQIYDGLPKAVSYTAVPNMGGVAVIYTGVSVTYPATSNPPTNAGTYSVVASTTDPNFAGTTSGTLTIQQAALTVTANDKSRAYGTANPTFDGTITGILHSDPITATYASIATQSSPVGTYPITPTLDDGGSGALANYAVTSNNGTLTITADPLYVIAPDNSRAFGVADSQGTPALVGLVNGDTASSVGKPMCSPATTPSSAPGSYAIVCFGVTSSNYTPTYINGTLSITNPLAQITSVQDSQSHTSETLEIGQTEQLTATGKLADNSTRTLAGGSGLSFSLSDLGKAVFGPAVAEAGGTLYAIGGNDGTNTLNTIQAYDPKNNAWTTITATLATARANAAVASAAGKIFVIGGVDGSGQVINSIEVLDTTSATPSVSSLTATLATARSKAGAVVWNQKLYVVAGKDGTGNPLSTVEAFDLVYGTSSQVDPGNAFDQASAAVLGNKLYVIGTNGSSVQMVSFDGTTWSAAVPSSLNAGNGVGMVAFNNLLYIVNGQNVISSDGTTFNPLSSLGNSHDGAQPAVIGSRIFIASIDPGPTSAKLDAFAPPEVTWSSADTNEATIDQAGAVNTLAITNPTVALTATSIADNSITGNFLLTVTKKSQTISFGTLSNATYGDPDVAISATSLDRGSNPTGLLVGFASADTSICTVIASTLSGNTSGAMVHIVSAGTCSITASQPGDSTTWQAASPVVQSFTIAQAPLTITANDQSKTYGSAFTFAGTEFAATGLLNGDKVTSVTLTSAGAAATATVAGSPYSIVPSAAVGPKLANYSISYVNGKFTVNPALASVTPDPGTKIYGSADPVLTGTLSGFLPADGVTATYGRTAGETVLGGPYTISATLAPAGVLSNYSITYNTASFTITPLAASVTPNAATKVYGSADPAFTGTLAGFLTADGVTATYTRTAGETVLGGPYTISAALAPAGVLGNYKITYNTAGFTITPQTASVTPNAANKTYGSADPALTGALSGFLVGDGVTATYSRTAGEMVPGPYTITATLAPAGVLSNYNITYNTANFTITPKAASVTPNTASKVYGSADPALTGTLSGFLPADGVTATYSRTTGETVLGGPYTISATLAPASVLGNYNVSYNTAAFTITPASLLITASSGATVYGAPIAVNAGYQGFVSGDMAGSLTSPPTCGPLFTPATPAGTYVTTCTGAVDPNYNISYAPGSVTVSPAATTTSVISAPNPSNWMQVVTITATVVNSSSTNVQPSGPVYFYNATGGGNCNTLPGNLALQIGTGTLTGISDTSVPNYLNTSTATVASPTLPTGTDTILACYGSNPADANYNPNFSPSNSTAFQTVTPAPIATLVANLSFGNQQAGTISPAQAATLCNGKSGTSASPCFNATDATAPLVVSSISFTGNNAGDFRFTTSPANLCGSSIPVGGSCTINVQFAPQAGTAGTATAVLNVVDNSGNIGGSTQTAPVVGAGVSTISSVGSLSTNAIFATNNGCSAVSISGNGMVDSYNGGNNAGNVGTNGNVSMNGNPIINGSVYSPFGTTGSCGKSMTGLSTSGKAQATGGLHTLPGPVSYPLPQSPSPVPPTTNWNITSCPSGLTGCTNNGSKSVTLAPGQYGNLSIGGGTTAHVKAGTYNLNSLSLTGNSVLYVDSGPVVINLAGAALSSNAAVFDSSGGSIVNPSGVTSNLQVYFARSNVIKLSGGSGSYALVYAPNATISITGGSHFYGSIVANTVSSSGNTAIHGDLSETAIAAGNTLWFSMSGLNVQGLPTNQTVKLYLTNAVLNFTANGQAQAPIAVPDAVITFSSTATSASTKWDAINNRWSTIVPTSSINSNSTIHTFFDGIALPVPAGGFPNGIQNVSLQAAFSTSSTGLSFSWQWGAAVYNAFGNNSALSVNPLDNTDPAGTPESYKPNLVFGDMGPGYVGMYVGSTSVIPTIAPANASPSSLDFGTVNVGTTTLGFMKSTLTNNQSGTTLTISSVTLGGTDPGDFALLVNTQEPGVVNCITGGSNPSYQSVSSLAPGQSCSIYATAAPVTVGKRSARVAFSDNANNSPQTVYLTVTGQ